MKTSSIKRLAVSLLAWGALPLASINAHEGGEPGHSHAPKAASAQEAWANAQSALKAIQAAAAAKQQQPIHNEQEKLAAALQQIQAMGVEGVDKARLEGAIKNAIAASDKVHVAADANDFAKVESSLKTLEATMGILEKQLNAAK